MNLDLGKMNGDVSALKALISFFTVYHFELTQENMDEMEQRFYLTPIVGFLYGLVMFGTVGVAVAAAWNFGGGWNFAVPIAALVTVYFGSRFLHFDGLTDFGDGMVVSGTREDHIRALKDTLVGAGGVGVALTVVIASFCAYMCTPLSMVLVLIPMSEVMLKVAMVFAAAFGKPSNGMAARQVSMTNLSSALISAIIGTICCLILACIGTGILWAAGLNPTAILVTGLLCMLFGLLISVLVGILMAYVANTTFGFVNGDILGATNEIARPIVLITMAAVASLFML